MREVAALIGPVFETDRESGGSGVLHWHEPADAEHDKLPDSRDLWKVIWTHRAHLYGIAHLHPWDGVAHATLEDLTTFDAVESGLGRPLYWWVATMTELAVYRRASHFIWQRVSWPAHAQHLTPWLEELRTRGKAYDDDKGHDRDRFTRG